MSGRRRRTRGRHVAWAESTPPTEEELTTKELGEMLLEKLIDIAKEYPSAFAAKFKERVPRVGFQNMLSADGDGVQITSTGGGW